MTTNSRPPMAAPHRASLRGKILLAVVGSSLFAIILAALALFAHQVFNQRTQFQRDMQALSRIVADYAVAPISFADEDGMREALSVLEARPEVIEAELVDPTGQVLQRFGASLTDEVNPAPPASSSTFIGWELLVTQSLQLRGEPYGHLMLVATFRPVFVDILRNFLPALLALLTVTLLIIGPVTWFLSGILLSGLQHLATSAAHIAETGDYGVRAPDIGEDEVGQLTRTFNAMLDKLQAADHDLRTINQVLNAEIAERARLEKALVESSRYAGMAEVATGVLHNVGNVLNSVNVSAQLVRERIETSRLTTLRRLVDLLQPHLDNPADFYAHDPKARLLPRLLTELHENLAEENRLVCDEMAALNTNIEHIKEVVSAQQSLARSAGVEENLIASELLEDAVRIHLASIKRHEVNLETDYAPDLRFVADRHNTLQILVNLVSNAIHAVKYLPPARRLIELRSFLHDEQVHFQVQDHGIGIAPEHLNRVFQHGFTTREEGHGFGLHSGSLAAKRMGGSLAAASDGLDQGATFTLCLPLNPSASLRAKLAPRTQPDPAPSTDS